LLQLDRKTIDKKSSTTGEQHMSIFTHVTLGTNDVNQARTFYDNVLEILGLKRIADLGDNGSIWGVDAPSLFVMKPNNGQPASVGNGNMVSFEAPSRAAIDAFHAAALSAGAQDEGQPGTRDWAPNAYAAYVRDLDGNKLAVYCFKEA
jgi:catechol 2,3-dioxygenase-like lactoylglutathione lyase family enzyme|tara:strand:+ start:3755 stop:4198 length:444 start_codon:yes stop_codon:yes gene_type:complete